ncbi:MAG: Ig-like domain-containing protein [Bacteroidia bacterium]|nr:Ig-like domain-containing protein [Bacteroidia bacterium]
MKNTKALFLLVIVLMFMSCKNATLYIAVTGVSFNKDTVRIAVGGTEQLEANVIPRSATIQKITWASSDDMIATVSENGLVSKISAGTAIVKAMTVDGKYISICTVEGVHVPVFLLAGQSNMSGDGKTFDLYYPSINTDLRITEVQHDVSMWWSNVYGSVTNHQWKDHRPNMMNDNQFGPEITLGRKLADSLGKKVYFIKIAQGGSSLKKDWTPNGGGSLFIYNILTQEVAFGIQALRDEGWVPEIRGLFWHQGETDSMYDDQASKYEDNLRGFIANVRAFVGNHNLPFFIGELGAIYPSSIFPFRSVVVSAQNAVVNGPTPVPDTYLIKTSDLGLLKEYTSSGIETGVHYDSHGYLVLGQRFANIFLSTNQTW